MNIEEAIQRLGACKDTLSDAEKSFLDDNGYLPLGRILTQDQVNAFISCLDKLTEIEGDEAGKELHQEDGTIRVSNLVNKGPMFDICFTHSRLLAGIQHVLGPSFKLSSLDCRMALPGQGHQALHVDWRTEWGAEDYYVCNSIWLLDDFTEENGATRLVPGSQCSGKSPREVLEDPTQPHPDEIQLVAPSGTVVIFNSHTWHSGRLNKTDLRRRAVLAYFCRRDQAQLTDQQKYICPETLTRLSEEARVILDVQ